MATTFRTDDPSKFRNLGKLGSARVGQTDVRTDTMRAFEDAALGLLLSALRDPSMLMNLFNPGASREGAATSALFGGGGGPQFAKPLSQEPGRGPTPMPGTPGPAPKPTPLPGGPTGGPSKPTPMPGGGGVGDGQPAGGAAPPPEMLSMLMSMLGARPMAQGGLLMRDELGLVGENGPELIKSGPLGTTVAPLSQGAVSAGSVGGTVATDGLPTAPGATQAQANPMNKTGGVIQDLATTNPGQGVLDALRPIFEQNLQFALGKLNAAVPSATGTGAALAGNDLTSQALNQFNLAGAQAMQQGVNQQLSAAGLASQRDLAQQQLAVQQFLALLGYGDPTGLQTLVSGG